MKIFVVALMLFVVKGTEARALSHESNGAPIRDGGSSVFEEPVLYNHPMNIQNLSAIFQHVAKNMTSLTREIQEQMQTFQANFNDQAVLVRDHLSGLLQGIQGSNDGISKLTMPSITGQLEILKRNISQLEQHFRPINFNQTSGEKMHQDLTQGMEQLQQLFGPLLQLFRGTITEGVENLRKSMGPGVHEIRRLVSLSESTDTPLETP